jgi:hypothetical protein
MLTGKCGNANDKYYMQHTKYDIPLIYQKDAYQQLPDFSCQPVTHGPFAQVVVDVLPYFLYLSVPTFSPAVLSTPQLHVPVKH